MINKNRLANIAIGTIIILLIYVFIRDWYHEKKLQVGTKTCTALVTKIISGTGVRQVAGVNYTYSINGKKYSGSGSGNYNFMDIGDTILIEYAIEDKEISKVIDKYYMKKYKNLKNKL